MKKSKILIGVFSLALVAVIGIGSTLAYFTDTKNVSNSVTMGSVAITLTNTDVLPGTLTPGAAYTVNPTVTSTGASSAYIRVKVDLLQDTEGTGVYTAVAGNSLTVGSTTITPESFFAAATGWTKGTTDGYYYYNTVLNQNDTALLAAVTGGYTFTVNPLWGNEVANLKLKLAFTAEAIQSTNLPAGATANSWPNGVSIVAA